MKTILTSGSEDNHLELDRPSAKGECLAFELLQATLLDSATIEAVQAMATVIQSHHKGD